MIVKSWSKMMFVQKFSNSESLKLFLLKRTVLNVNLLLIFNNFNKDLSSNMDSLDSS